MIDWEKRNVNLDFIRCIAVFSVISVHFFLHCGFYNELLVGGAMIAAAAGRTLFIIGVPLFIQLTGYLKNKKTLSKKHYFGIKKTVIIYVLATICAILYRKYVWGEGIGVLSGIHILFSYQQYSWFVEMYFGLFMLIPFLNLIYHNLKNKKEKLFLIGIMICLTALPTLINSYNFSVDGWFASPTLAYEYHKIIPAWWVGIYPLTFYFIGAFYSEYRDEITLKLPVIFLLLVGSLALCVIYNIWRSNGGVFVSGDWNSHSGFQSLLFASLLFLFLLKLDLTKLPIFVKKLMYHISRLAFGIYLCSWIFDQYAYPILVEKIPVMIDRLPYYFVMVPFVFLCSAALSFVLDKIYSLIDWVWGLIKKQFRKKETMPQ